MPVGERGGREEYPKVLPFCTRCGRGGREDERNLASSRANCGEGGRMKIAFLILGNLGKQTCSCNNYIYLVN
jgi:hypothetical protein